MCDIEGGDLDQWVMSLPQKNIGLKIVINWFISRNSSLLLTYWHSLSRWYIFYRKYAHFSKNRIWRSASFQLWVCYVWVVTRGRWVKAKDEWLQANEVKHGRRWSTISIFQMIYFFWMTPTGNNTKYGKTRHFCEDRWIRLSTTMFNL